MYVILIEEDEQFLENKKLTALEYEEGTIYEVELRGACRKIAFTNPNYSETSKLNVY